MQVELQLIELDMWVWLELVSTALLAFTLILLSTEKARKYVISSETYKRLFACHMCIFMRIYNRAVDKQKRNLFSHLPATVKTVEGDILEIGSGTGANFQFYPDGSSLIALDPNRYMEAYLKMECAKFSGLRLKRYLTGCAEDIKEVGDESIAAVVCTLTLCSVEDVPQVLREIKRVLKPGGRFYFMEHVAAENGTITRKLQHKFDTFWKYLSDGCTCEREAWSDIESAGFSQVCYERFHARKLMSVAFLMKSHIMGYAVK